LKNVVKVNIFLSDMTNFAAMNRVYDTFWDEPKPVSQILYLLQRKTFSVLWTLKLTRSTTPVSYLRRGQGAAYEDGCGNRVYRASVGKHP
jgi:hypothetical protein